MEKILGKKGIAALYDKIKSIVNDSIEEPIFRRYQAGNYSPSAVMPTCEAYYAGCAVAEGYSTYAGPTAHSEGYHTRAVGDYSHTEGYYTYANATGSHAEGNSTIAAGNSSHAEGHNTTATRYAQHAQGTYNIADTDGNSFSYYANSDALIIGNGSSDYNRSNAFRVTFGGQTYGLSSFNSSGADYAEYFEWFDGNVDNEDRIGHFVSLVNGKIKIAEPGEDIIGIISGMSSVIGNANEDMHHGMYVRDVFGRFIYEDVEVERETGERDEEGKPIMETVTEHRIKLNPEYDSNKKYIPRSERKEWDVVGLLGQIVVIDDGSCEVGKRCTVASGGIATDGSDYRVMQRLDENHVLVLANFL